MNTSDLGQLTYLVILAIAVAGWFITENRHALGKTIRMALAWAFIFLGVVAGWGLWSDIRDDLAPMQSVFAEEARVEVPRAFDGHYYLTLAMDGTPVTFVVDTGATEIVLTQQDAERIGLDPDALIYTGRANTANGMVATAMARVDEVTLGPIVDRGVRVSVNGGEMETSLLGMSYLQQFERIEIADGRLILER